MRMSESLRKNIFHASVGGIINKLRIKRRRSTFFFEEIGAEYIRRCEEHGHEKEMMNIGKGWMSMLFEKIVIRSLRRVPPTILLNMIVRNLWVTGGLMDDFQVSKKENIVKIDTVNEGLTRFMGKNKFMIGFYTGILSTLFKRKAESLDAMQTKRRCRYTFRLIDEGYASVRSKEKSVYDRLNKIKEVKGHTLKDLLEMNVFQLKDNNRVYFHNRSISPIENTLFHMIGNRGIMLDDVPKISYNYFRDIVKGESDTKRLGLIKTLLQAMGWGIINIVVKDKRIMFGIKNPPYGLQVEKDNWDFMARVILGYLWLLDRKFRISKTETRHMYLKITYCR